jgi:hypothetical protein
VHHALHRFRRWPAGAHLGSLGRGEGFEHAAGLPFVLGFDAHGRQNFHHASRFDLPVGVLVRPSPPVPCVFVKCGVRLAIESLVADLPEGIACLDEGPPPEGRCSSG